MSAEKAISTDKAPAAIGPYSQARRAGELLFISGQIALDPASGRMIGENAAEQTARVMQNLGAVLRAAGLGWEDVVNTTVFLADLDDFEAMNQVYAGFFPPGADPPARACVQTAALPKGALVEIEAVAHGGPGG